VKISFTIEYKNAGCHLYKQIGKISANGEFGED